MRGAAGGFAAALAAAALASLGAHDTRAHDTRVTWPYATLMERIAGRTLRLPDRRVRVDRDLVICSGEGRPVRRRGTRRWRHFTCTQTLFVAGGVGKDVTFRVHVLTRRRSVFSHVRYGPS